MKRKTSLLILAVAVMIAAGPAAAIPFGETAQKWNFDNNSNPAIPEIDLNPYGTATGAIDGSASGPPPEWAADLLGRDGVWQAEGMLTITLDIPNQMIANPYKEIRLEIGFIGDLADFSVFPIPLGGSVELVGQHVVVVDPATGWKKLTAKYIIEPNPDREIVNYSFAGAHAAIDYVIVKTICVPEPMTVSLLGLGGLILARRRR
ncbi:MAG TPA: PEP-CTERM sorting domain-containing protein [Sedimentisphaerales bacterium]|nr:PEP-CTERM sorting domain-containing protein [Sedimentisphaerales bacterium]